MNKETVIATLRADLSLSEAFQTFLAGFDGDDNAWFARHGGDFFLSEFGSEWNSTFKEIAQSVSDDYFRTIGLSEEDLPKVTLTDSRARLLDYGSGANDVWNGGNCVHNTKGRRRPPKNC